MRPTMFPQATGTLLGGPATDYGTEQDVENLPVYRGDGELISCWRPSWVERLRVLFLGRVWLRVASNTTHPPVEVSAGEVF